VFASGFARRKSWFVHKNIVGGLEHASASYRGKLVKKGYPNPHHLLDHLPKTNLII
jgi:hypothetical protein